MAQGKNSLCMNAAQGGQALKICPHKQSPLPHQLTCRAQGSRMLDASVHFYSSSPCRMVSPYKANVGHLEISDFRGWPDAGESGGVDGAGDQRRKEGNSENL